MVYTIGTFKKKYNPKTRLYEGVRFGVCLIHHDLSFCMEIIDQVGNYWINAEEQELEKYISTNRLNITDYEIFKLRNKS